MRAVFWISLSVFLMSSCEGPTPKMAGFEVHGIDISHYQGQIDWDQVLKQDIDFVFIKATEGQSLRDSLFENNWKILATKNVKKGAYHFYRPAVDPKKQAINFLNFVDFKPGDLPPVLDLEVTDEQTDAQIVKDIQVWLNIVEKSVGVAPIIYTYQKFFKNKLEGKFDQYPLWIARYNNNKKPNIKKNGDWDFWQYGNRGQMEGIHGDVDFNVFRGSKSDLEKLCMPFNEELSPSTSIPNYFTPGLIDSLKNSI